jgi:F-type H+-transporting ATPase subunit alpha
VESISKFETELLRFMRETKNDLKTELREKKVIDDSLKAKIISAVEDFKKGFVA